MAICKDKLYNNASIKQLENYIWKYDTVLIASIFIRNLGIYLSDLKELYNEI